MPPHPAQLRQLFDTPGLAAELVERKDLQTLGDRENDAAGLQEAVAAYRAALEEYTRDRVPL